MYFADSMGGFRYGHPLDSDGVKEKKTLQLLIHPIWWVIEEQDPINVLQRFIAQRSTELKSHIAMNCKVFK